MGCCFSIRPLDAQELTQGKLLNDFGSDFKNMGSTAVLDYHDQILGADDQDQVLIDEDIIESELSPLMLPIYSSENSIASWKNPASPLHFK